MISFVSIYLYRIHGVCATDCTVDEEAMSRVALNHEEVFEGMRHNERATFHPETDEIEYFEPVSAA